MKLDEMNVDTLITYAESLGIDVTEFHFETLDAMSLDDGSIAYDPRKFKTARRLISALIHEIGHVQTGTFYNYQAPRWLREKAEDTADRMALQMFLPKKELERAMKRLGVQFRWHDLRHTYCSMLYSAGVDVKTAAYLMGHADVTVTMKIYTHLSEQKQAESTAGLLTFFDSLAGE